MAGPSQAQGLDSSPGVALVDLPWQRSNGNAVQLADAHLAAGSPPLAVAAVAVREIAGPTTALSTWGRGVPSRGAPGRGGPAAPRPPAEGPTRVPGWVAGRAALYERTERRSATRSDVLVPTVGTSGSNTEGGTEGQGIGTGAAVTPAVTGDAATGGSTGAGGAGGAGDSDGRGGLWHAQRRDRRDRETAQVVPLVSEASASAAGTEDNPGAPLAHAAAEATVLLEGQQPSEGSPYSERRPLAGGPRQDPEEAPAVGALGVLAPGQEGSAPAPDVVAGPDRQDTGALVSGPGSSLASGSQTGGREGDALLSRASSQPLAGPGLDPCGPRSDSCGQGAAEGGPWGGCGGLQVCTEGPARTSLPAQAAGGVLGQEPMSPSTAGGIHGGTRRPTPFLAQQGGAWIERFLGRMPTPASSSGPGSAQAFAGSLRPIQEKPQQDPQQDPQFLGGTGVGFTLAGTGICQTLAGTGVGHTHADSGVARTPVGTGAGHPPAGLGALGHDSLRLRQQGEGMAGKIPCVGPPVSMAAASSSPGAASATVLYRGSTFLARFAGQHPGGGPASFPSGSGSGGPLRTGRGEGGGGSVGNEAVLLPQAWPLTSPQPAPSAQASLGPRVPGGTSFPLPQRPPAPPALLPPLLPGAASGARWQSAGLGAGPQTALPHQATALSAEGAHAPALSVAASAIQRPQGPPENDCTASASAARVHPGLAAAQASQDVLRWPAGPLNSAAGKLPQSPGMSAHSDGRQGKPEDVSESEEGPAREAREKGSHGQAAPVREPPPRGHGAEVAQGVLQETGHKVGASLSLQPPASTAPQPLASTAPQGPARTSSSSRGGSNGSRRRVSEARLRSWRRDAADAWSSLMELAEVRLGEVEKGLPFSLPPHSHAPGEAAALCPPGGMPPEEGPGERSLPLFLQAQAARAALGMPMGRRALEKGHKCLRCGALGHCFLLCSEWASDSSEGPGIGDSSPQQRQAQVGEALCRKGLFAMRSSRQVLPETVASDEAAGRLDDTGRQSGGSSQLDPERDAGEGGPPTESLAEADDTELAPTHALSRTQPEARKAEPQAGRAQAQVREAQQVRLLWTPACITCLGPGHWAAECEVMQERIEGMGAPLSPGPGTTERTQPSSGTRSGMPRRKRRRTSACGSSAWGSQSAAQCKPAESGVDVRNVAGGGREPEPGHDTGGLDCVQEVCREAHGAAGKGGSVQERERVKDSCGGGRETMDIVLKEEGGQKAGRVWGGSAQGGGPTAQPFSTVLVNTVPLPSNLPHAAKTQGGASPGYTPLAPESSPTTGRIPKEGAATDECGAAVTNASTMKNAGQPRGVPRAILEELESIRLSRKHIAR